MQESSLPLPSRVINDAFDALEIETDHDERSLAETEYWLANPGIDNTDLLDLATLPFVTIDNEDSKDLDQALYIEKESDNYRLRYALADAAYYIKPGSALFEAALLRGTTYYAPQRAAPMLPAALSEGLISLNPDSDRRALVFDMTIDPQATVIRCSIERARIHSHAKLSYEGVQQWLDSEAQNTRTYHPSLRALRELGQLLIQAGERRGVVRFDRSETQITVAGSPPRLQANLRERFDTERYNEQLSLICNMQGAKMLLAMAGVSDVVQSVYRVHEAPLQKSLKRLRQTLNELADRQQEPALWRWQKDHSLANFVENLPSDEQHHRMVRAVQRQIMLAQRASVFQPDPGEHHALKASSYARFSSPMREIVGIFTHKELLEALNGKTGLENTDNNLSDEALRAQVIEAANSARQKQRKLDKTIELAALYSIFSRELCLEQAAKHTGTIMGMRTGRLYLHIDDMALEVKVYLDDLEEQYETEYNIEGIEALPADKTRPGWHLGQGVVLHIRDYDKARKRLIFSIDSY